MTFWEEHARAEEALARVAKSSPRAPKGTRKADHRPASQNAAQSCARCPHVGDDVIFGICLECFTRRTP